MAKKLVSNKCKFKHKPPPPLLTPALEEDLKGQGFEVVVGIDEAGRGPLAGPVVASAVVIRDFRFLSKISDSKKLSAERREDAFHEIMEKAVVGVGIVSESVIDRINILEATFKAMTNAVDQLFWRLPDAERIYRSPEKVCLLIDGNSFKSDLPFKRKTIVKGDQTVLSIACASIVAKVTRDRILCMYDQVFPQYGFRQHKGYPTEDHRQAIRQFGPSEIHRMSFAF